MAVDLAPQLPALQALPAPSEQQSQDVRTGIGSDLKVRAEQRPAKPARDERRDVAQSLARARWAEWGRNKAG
jgi:hypothetical protein